MSVYSYILSYVNMWSIEGNKINELISIVDAADKKKPKMNGD